MNTLEKAPESKIKIRFPDCDPFNHLNNAKYIDYFFNAREDQLLSYYNFDLHQLAKEKGIGWVVSQNQVAYLVPATLMETVVIETRLLSGNEKSLVLEALMWNEDKSSLKAILWSKLVHYNIRTKKRESHSPELMQLFGQIENPLAEALSFEDRVKTFKDR